MEGTKLVARRIVAVDSDDLAAIEKLDAADRPVEVAAVPAPVIAPPPPAIPRTPTPQIPWRFGAPVFLILALGLAAGAIVRWQDPAVLLAVRTPPTPIILLEFALLLFSIALTMWLTRPPFEVADTGKSGGTFRPPWAIGSVVIAALCTYGLLSPIMMFPNARTGGWAALPLLGKNQDSCRMIFQDASRSVSA